MTPAITVYTAIPEYVQRAAALSARLHLPWAAPDNKPDHGFLLVLTPDYIGLEQVNSRALPFYIDFRSGKMRYRSQHASLRREALARALGLKSQHKPLIVDATAGLGRDSFILASLGFDVTLLERSPIIYTLLEDAIQRAKQDAATAILMDRLHPYHTDAIKWLQENKTAPQIIYLDPMFPERKKSAQAKKEMQIFQAIIGEDIDADQLLSVALTCATERVVVKRPLSAEPVAGRSPTYDVRGSSSRFDVYLTPKSK